MSNSNHIMWMNKPTEMNNGEIFNSWKAMRTNILVIDNKINSFDLIIGDRVVTNSDCRKELMTNTIVNRDSGEIFFNDELIGFTND